MHNFYAVIYSRVCIYIYIYMCVCVCVCVYVRARARARVSFIIYGGCSGNRNKNNWDSSECRVPQVRQTLSIVPDEVQKLSRETPEYAEVQNRLSVLEG